MKYFCDASEIPPLLFAKISEIICYSTAMIKTPELNYSSNLTDIIIQLEHLRGRSVPDSTSQQVFVQLKNLFHINEALDGFFDVPDRRIFVTLEV